jgi:hypothetical protein
VQVRQERQQQQEQQEQQEEKSEVAEVANIVVAINEEVNQLFSITSVLCSTLAITATLYTVKAYPPHNASGPLGGPPVFTAAVGICSCDGGTSWDILLM